jgi:hypothetical protein
VRVAASRAARNGCKLDPYLIDSLPQAGHVIRVELGKRSGESLHVMEADLSAFLETSERIAGPSGGRVSAAGIRGISDLVARLRAKYALYRKRRRSGGR